ncbi:MAG: replicative DNA helicase [Clostridia bacterium]|nr:replicative DNA helicase [Clostridia bacterium]
MADIYLTDEPAGKMPFSLEAEQSVLGTIILDPDKIRDVANSIKTEDFYHEHHRVIYEAMRELFLNNNTIDAVTLVEELVKSGTYDDAGGKSYVALLAQSVPSIANLNDYLRIIRDKALLRRLIEASGEISRMAYAAEGNAADILDRSEQLIFDIADKNETKGFSHIKDVILANYKHLDELIKNGSAALGTPTYFTDIDKLLVGMGKSDLVLVGARPGMGKTSFCLNIASQVALKTKKTVVVFSLEMSCEQLVSRMLSSEALIDSYKMRKGDLSEEDWVKLARASGVLSQTDILIDDTAGITVMGMKAKLRRVKNLGLVVIDYLQLMQSDRRSDNRVTEVGDISRALKLMAKELEVPIITCAQLSRGPENRPDKTPMLSDLRDSGAIEQDADSVMFLYRDEYYNNDPEKKNMAKCIIAKNRHGSTGTVELGWFGQYTKFTNLETTHVEP